MNTEWKRGEYIAHEIYSTELSEHEISGVRRVEITLKKAGSIILTIETDKGTSILELHPTDLKQEGGSDV